MSAGIRRYWAIRTDRNNRSLLLGELRDGRLRQGWGHDPSQDLRSIQAEVAGGGKWWERLTNVQQEVLPHLRMLSSSTDSIQLGDWILVPNLPEQGSFLVAEVTGDYHYMPLPLCKENDISDLQCRIMDTFFRFALVTEEAGSNKLSEMVDASIRRTLKVPMRMWNVDVPRRN